MSVTVAITLYCDVIVLLSVSLCFSYSVIDTDQIFCTVLQFKSGVIRCQQLKWMLL